MPVYDRSYRRWEGTRTRLTTRFLVIADLGVRNALRSRWVWVLLAVTAIHIAIRVAVLYFTSQVLVNDNPLPDEISDQVTLSGRFLADALQMQIQWVLMVLTVLVATPSLARDLDAGALSFYFSKPITRFEYAMGKLLPPFLLGLGVTALPALVLWVAGVALVPARFLPDGIWLMPGAVVLAGVVASAFAALVGIGLSGLIQNARLASATWVAWALITGAVSTIMYATTDRPGTLLVHLFGPLNGTTQWLLGASGSNIPHGGAVALAFAYIAAGAAVLWVVLRDPEVAA